MTDAGSPTPSADPLQTQFVRELTHEQPLLCCRYDPSGKVLAAGSQDNNVVRWNLESNEKSVLSVHDTWVYAVAFSRDGATLLSAGCDGRLIWWDNLDVSRPPIRKVDAHAGWIRALDVSPDGTLVATGGNDNHVKVFRVDSGEQVADLVGHELHVYSVLFHPTGEFLLSGDLLGSVRQWNVASSTLVRSFDAKKLENFNGGQRVHYGGVRSLAVSCDQTQLAAGGLHKATNPLGNVQEPLILVFDWESGQEKLSLEVGETMPLIVSRLVYHPSGFLMAAMRYNEGYLMFWKDQQPHIFHKHKVAGGALDMDLHPDSLQVATAHHDGKIRISRMQA
jgi:WD40 repeat protein